MTYTNRARLALALSPLWVPLLLLGDVLAALIAGGCEVTDTLGQGVADTCRTWYRSVWRVARYGSVLDD